VGFPRFVVVAHVDVSSAQLHFRLAIVGGLELSCANRPSLYLRTKGKEKQRERSLWATVAYWGRACTRRECYHVENTSLDYDSIRMSGRCAFEVPIPSVALRTACDLAWNNICRGRYAIYAATPEQVPTLPRRPPRSLSVNTERTRAHRNCLSTVLSTHHAGTKYVKSTR